MLGFARFKLISPLSVSSPLTTRQSPRKRGIKQTLENPGQALDDGSFDLMLTTLASCPLEGAFISLWPRPDVGCTQGVMFWCLTKSEMEG